MPSLGPHASLPGLALGRPSTSMGPATSSGPRAQRAHARRSHTGVIRNTLARTWRRAFVTGLASSFVGCQPFTSTWTSLDVRPVTRMREAADGAEPDEPGAVVRSRRCRAHGGSVQAPGHRARRVQCPHDALDAAVGERTGLGHAMVVTGDERLGSRERGERDGQRGDQDQRDRGQRQRHRSSGCAEGVPEPSPCMTVIRAGGPRGDGEAGAAQGGCGRPAAPPGQPPRRRR